MIKKSAIFSDGDVSEFRINGTVWNFHDEKTQPHLHALHPYPARFIPQIPRQAIKKWTGKGDLVLDPFCGCGTTLLESILLERPAMGIDNNAVACLVSKAKTSNYSKKDIELLKSFNKNFSKLSERKISKIGPEAWPLDYHNIKYWFDEEAIFDLGVLRSSIDELPKRAKLLALAVFSSIIVRASHQDSDTRYARIDREYISGSAIKRFQSKLDETIKRALEILEVPKASCQVYQQDSRNLGKIKDSCVNLIVTSPPYLNAYDYHKYHRHRLHWIGGDVKFARDLEIGKHDTFTRSGAKPDLYFEDMKKCFNEWYRILVPGGRALIVIGDAIVSGQPVPVGDNFVKICEDIGLINENRWIRALEKSKKSFNLQSRISEEHVLLFKKN